MRDLLLETVELQRIILFTKLVANGDCTNSEKELALQWLGEMTGSLERNLKQYHTDKENPHERGSHDSHSRRGFQ
ncbi:hypothetical protein AUM99_18475 [Cronobacter sakazakii]|nr:hypothetical protein AUM99_18475 [Cronobacter sakazakii]